jgi:hypothetical protein
VKKSILRRSFLFWDDQWTGRVLQYSYHQLYSYAKSKRVTGEQSTPSRLSTFLPSPTLSRSIWPIRGGRHTHGAHVTGEQTGPMELADLGICHLLMG